MNQRNQMDQTNQRNLSRLPCNEYVRGENAPAPWNVNTIPWGPAQCSVKTTTCGSLFHWDQINGIKTKVEISSWGLSSQLIARNL